MKALLSSIALFWAVVQCEIIEIPNGKLQGSYNGEYYSFTNIPYAQPPTGTNRFKPPIPYTDKWTGIRNATGESVSCVQFAQSYDPSNGIEDCLVINVFTPDIKPETPYPVRVFIFGGAFMIGTSAGVNEKNVVRENVVFAVFNYRVGPFGFLSSGDDLVSGNFGLKDQQLALKWVYENIQAFGGDSTKIHLTGASAGSGSTHLHLLNPSSWPYFNAVLSSSGSALNPWILQQNPKERFKNYIGHLGCDSSSRDEIEICLQNRTKEEHFRATEALKTFRDNPVNLFSPVIEPENVSDAFLTEHPRILIRKGQISSSPWVVAHTEREGSATAAEFLSYDENGKELIGILNSRWHEIAPVILFYNNTCVSCSEEEAQKYRDTRSDILKEVYLQDKNFSVKTYPQLEQMFTDTCFTNGIAESIDLHRRFGHANVYEYFFKSPIYPGVGNVLSMRLDLQFGK